jgi:hypothetical protein
MARPRAADDFEAIRMRMNELRRECEQISNSDQNLRTDRQQARNDGVRNLSDQGGPTRDGSRSLPRPR